jgi:hypothetical protein
VSTSELFGSEELLEVGGAPELSQAPPEQERESRPPRLASNHQMFAAHRTELFEAQNPTV